jgi:hypothetical protein
MPLDWLPKEDIPALIPEPPLIEPSLTDAAAEKSTLPVRTWELVNEADGEPKPGLPPMAPLSRSR